MQLQIDSLKTILNKKHVVLFFTIKANLSFKMLYQP